jgi:para-nitrobenzyl esterase
VAWHSLRPGSRWPAAFRATPGHPSWQGVRKAESPAPFCVQKKVGQEACLSLNVFSPANASNPLPVIVNIHGGGFVGGHADSTSPAALIRSNPNVVVVTPQYRLGVFGFFNPDPSQAPPNYGILDQQLALRWVQANIAAFGGDPDRVMIAGCSAGGASVSLHLVMPSSYGLYHSAAIENAGSCGPLKMMFEHEPRWRMYASLICASATSASASSASVTSASASLSAAFAFYTATGCRLCPRTYSAPPECRGGKSNG